MIAGTRQKTVGSTAYRHDPLYAYSKAFTEAAQNILTTESYDIFGEPARALRSNGVREALKEFFVNEFVDDEDPTKTVDEIEEAHKDIEAMFENDMEALSENAYQSEYAPMIGMSLPIHKLILMNNVFSQGGGIQKVTAVQPAFTISMERRILVTPKGEEIDMFLEQNKIADAIDSTAPTEIFDLDLPQNEDTDIIGQLGGTVTDELSMETHIAGIYVENVYFAEGDHLPDEDGWFSTKGELATAETAGTKNVWYPVDIAFTPSYGGPNRLERVISQPISIRYKTDADGGIAEVKDTLFGAMNNSKITLTAVKGTVKKVRLAAKLNTSNATLVAGLSVYAFSKNTLFFLTLFR